MMRPIAITLATACMFMAPARADPPFGKHPAYIEPVSGNQVVCQVADATCMRVGAYVFETVAPWIADPTLVAAVTAQNAAMGKLTNLEINKLDLAWIEHTDPSLEESRMHNAAAAILLTRKESAQGAIIEIFAFDQYGLNVAQTDPTQDYNQGDEAKYWRTFMSGAGAIYIDRPRPDDGKPVAQASLTITDPVTGRAIGGMTVGIDVSRLGR